jgi:hypothetical protein
MHAWADKGPAAVEDWDSGSEDEEESDSKEEEDA